MILSNVAKQVFIIIVGCDVAKKAKKLLLSQEAKAVLEQQYRKGQTHCYRERCRMILLKAEGRPSKDIARQVSSCKVRVNAWVKHYEPEGIAGLQTKPGRGRDPILAEANEAVIRAAVQAERQRLSQATRIIETELDKHSACLR